MNEEQTKSRRTLVGKVVSDKMDKTITVEVLRLVEHPVYRKYMKRSKRYKAHDENNEYKVNDQVVIAESRPLSKTKRWTVVERQTQGA